MSVSKMKRLTVFARKERLDELVKKLIRLRCVEISNDKTFDEDELSLSRINCDSRRLELEAQLGEINEAIKTLNVYVKKAKGLFSGRNSLDMDSFVAKGHFKKAQTIVEQTLEAQKKENKIKDDIAKCQEEIVAARPFFNYDAPLGLEHTETSEIILGVLPGATDMDAMGRALYDAGAIFNVLSMDSVGVYVSIFCHRSDASAVTSLLTSYGFLKSNFAGNRQTARESIKDANRRIKLLASEHEAIKAKLGSLAEQLAWVEAMYDVVATELVSVNQKIKFVSTESVAIINGWIPIKREQAVKAFLEEFECAYEIRDPEGEEIPPILLENNGFASNFEWVLGMYSYPMYGKFDPTFIMSIFYFIIFGIMFADAGYGLILLLACFGAVSFLKLSDGMKRFMKMFGYCGISCIIFGVLFGAYFGDLPLAIMRNMMGMSEDQLPNLALLGSDAANLALLFDPLQNPMGFLIFSLAIGAVHLIAGMAVQFVVLCKNKQALDAIFDIGFYWLLFAGVALWVLLPSIGMWVTIAAAALIVLTHGRAEKNIVMKIAKGLLGLYDLINYVADLLSYSRILALGLAAGIIAQVVNILGTMGGPTVFGFIVLVVAFVVGHLLNLAINVLGTFVHTSRLQYIEFFGKFYEDGGIPFEPALPSEKYTQEKQSQKN